MKYALFLLVSLYIVFAGCQMARTEYPVKSWGTAKPGLRVFPEWPENGTFWECGIELGFFPDSDEAHTCEAAIYSTYLHCLRHTSGTDSDACFCAYEIGRPDWCEDVLGGDDR